ncbi:---NA--- [Paramuricea clavata]|uniref:---NA n=1 Tax=Paramuricea clavata TaxID=317549 RepID=A0A7D9HH70_PARCT|nr:---NA--- [Paramuricea clavata]
MAKDTFANLYKKFCVENKKRKDCGLNLLKRKGKVCNTNHCLKKFIFKKFGKRSATSQDLNKQPFMNDNVAVPKVSRSKRGFWMSVANKAALYNECCSNACRDSDIVKYCFTDKN